MEAQEWEQILPQVANDTEAVSKRADRGNADVDERM
ncbi:MAG: hypothetical protein ACI8RD_008840 [Bacillariaceae sp.]|jgi:hypothetical protein